jgi:hypothetical protein
MADRDGNARQCTGGVLHGEPSVFVCCTTLGAVLLCRRRAAAWFEPAVTTSSGACLDALLGMVLVPEGPRSGMGVSCEARSWVVVPSFSHEASLHIAVTGRTMQFGRLGSHSTLSAQALVA